MSLIICGINHKTASLALREQFVISAEQLSAALQDANKQAEATEIVLVSTCNRLEIYAINTTAEKISAWLARFFSIDANTLAPLLYFYHDDAAIQHILRVACGIDSMIVGEPQILGQLKSAYNVATQTGTVGKQLGHLFPFVFATTKKIRNDTAINHFPVSIAYAAVSLSKHIFTDLQQATVLLIGAGNTIELAAQYLFDYQVKQIIVANRTLDRAHGLAQKFNATSITIGDIPKHLAKVDIVFSSTASQLPILGKGLLERILKQRKRKPIFMVDLAVPRDIEPEVGELEDIYLYNIDDLEHVIKENQRDRLVAAQQAEKMIMQEAEHFKHWQDSLESVPVIRSYREHVEQIRVASVEKALHELQSGKTPSEVVHELSHQLANKLMHEPTVQMRQAGYRGQNDMLEWAKKILGIKN